MNLKEEVRRLLEMEVIVEVNSKRIFNSAAIKRLNTPAHVQIS